MPWLRHPDVSVPGGPVPDVSVPFWEARGWEPITDEEAEELRAGVSPDRPLTDLTKDDLSVLAQARGVELPSKATKADIISALDDVGEI